MTKKKSISNSKEKKIKYNKFHFVNRNHSIIFNCHTPKNWVQSSFPCSTQTIVAVFIISMHNCSWNNWFHVWKCGSLFTGLISDLKSIKKADAERNNCNGTVFVCLACIKLWTMGKWIWIFLAQMRSIGNLYQIMSTRANGSQ